MKTKSITTRKLILTAFFTALIAVCSQIMIPLPAIPINLALFAVFLAGSLLGPKYGCVSCLVYLLLGAIGVPVFAGMQGGLGILLGKTGGYAIGYVFCALVTGILAKKLGGKFLPLCLSMVAGLAVCYIFGTAWFMVLTKTSLLQSLIYCVFPFLIGDAIKISLASILTVQVKKRIDI